MRRIASYVMISTMPILVGIDEVGYGPKLGPLIVAAVAVRVGEPTVDLWDALSSVVGRSPSERKAITVCDSKRLYTPSYGIGVLERTALPFLELFPHVRSNPKSEARTKSKCSKGYLDIGDFVRISSFGFEAGPKIGDSTASLRSAMKAAGIEPLSIAVRSLDPAAFNERVGRTGNKATLLFDLVAELIAELMDGAKGERFFFHIGKQGGKRRYLRDFVRAFPGAGILVAEERREESRYQLRSSAGEAEIAFLIDGEDRAFLIALASIVGKYLREVEMGRFNAFWQSRVDGLRPTSGYLPDADRFLADIDGAIVSANLSREEIVRNR